MDQMTTGRPSKRGYDRLIERLLYCLGISEESFKEAIAWSLCEHMVAFIAQDKDSLLRMRNKRDFIAVFAKYLHKKTGCKWHLDDINALQRRVLLHLERHDRKMVRYEEWLRLLFTTPVRCARCGATPPHVRLEIDHVFPCVKGGSSRSENLQYLCRKCNRQKSSQLEVGKPWLRFE
jgi:hypothetical protein